MRFDTDPHLHRYAARVAGMRASEIRALFSLISRPEIVSLAGGSPETRALDYNTVEDVVVRVIRDHGPVALQYGIGQGRPELREQLVTIMAAEGITAHVDDVIVTVGGQQAIELVTKCFVDPGDVILAEGPTYVGALGAFASHQADVIHVPLDADGMQIDALEDELDRLDALGTPPTFLYVIPNHQNPAGVSMSIERRQRLAQIVVARDLLVVEDNPYGLLDFDGQTWPSLRSMVPDNVIYIGTVSKSFAAGARTGWIVAPRPIRDKLILLREAADLCPSSLTQMIVETWFATTPWQDQLKRFREVYAERAGVMLDALTTNMPAGVTWTRPGGGFFVWLTLPPGLDSGDLLAKAIHARVAYVPGRGFFADGTGSSHLRLCYSFAEPERIREGVTRLGEVVTEELSLVQAILGTSGPTNLEGSGPAGLPGSMA